MDKRLGRFLVAGLLTFLAIATLGKTAAAQSPPRSRDLEGTWDANTMTPLQRPPEFAAKPNFTTEEGAEYERTFFARALSRFAAADQPFQSDLNDVFVVPPKLEGLRTSLIVDPENGLLPSASSRVSARQPFKRSYDDPESLTLVDRCLVGTTAGYSLASPPLVPSPVFDNFLQIVQTENTVVISAEWIHDTRIVRVGGRHLPTTVRKWLGDSIGNWEGDTLVVDTTNFRADSRNQGASANLHVIERFTKLNDRAIHYRVTVDDPDTWVRPWTAEWSLKATDAQFIEVACHEGNYNTENFLRGARADEERAASGSDRDR